MEDIPQGIPQSQYAPPPPVFPEPDLTLNTLMRLVWSEWKTNPVGQRVWRRARPWIFAIAGVQFLFSLFVILAQVLFAGKGVGALPIPATMFAILMGVGGCFLLTYFLVLALVVPAKFGDWGYRFTYLDDPNLRLSSLSRQERVLGILVPGIAGVTLYVSSTVPTQVVQILSAQLFGTPAGVPSLNLTPDSISILFAVLTVFTSNVAHAIGAGMVFASVALRKMIQTSGGFAPGSKGVRYLAPPYIYYLLVSMLYGFARSGLLMLIIGVSTFYMMRSGGSGRPPSFPAIPGIALVGNYAWFMIADLLFVLGLHAVLRPMWKRDIQLARLAIFDAEGFRPMEPLPPNQ